MFHLYIWDSHLKCDTEKCGLRYQYNLNHRLALGLTFGPRRVAFKPQNFGPDEITYYNGRIGIESYVHSDELDWEGTDVSFYVKCGVGRAWSTSVLVFDEGLWSTVLVGYENKYNRLGLGMTRQLGVGLSRGVYWPFVHPVFEYSLGWSF